eukprot:TRINITY_DN10169_c0_g2_i2.p1 TRINITY_DN10169_c0_g2~~TRINITY_DN10169_c0_g2_i2.p1  ORF type:complete len:1070 (+),score=237.07 TRINITY_DN10169_c0_g2_i2:81-3290(+)
MAGMEVLAAIGLIGTELFSYNRKSYEFDQDQRFEREELRLNMQIERFKLFREDVRDLVELTVGKMDLYHLVGAFFCKMGVIYYCEGIIHGQVPPYLLVLYYLSASCAFAFLILAVCLAMHASITSHSYGTRLLCRYVRLPIPSAGQMSVMNARYSDFEKHGTEMMRVPFVSETNRWQQRNQEQERAERAGGRAFGLHQVLNTGMAPPRAAPEHGAAGASHDAGHATLLGEGHAALEEETELLQAVDFRTERHVQLFRKLQGKWQCFDAYARVCMALGMRQLVQGITYYLIGVVMVENKSPTVALGLILILQSACVLVFMLDVYHTLGCCNNFDIQVMGTLPTFTTFLAILTALPTSETEHDLAMWEYSLSYWLTIPCFLCEIIWFELLVSVSTPTKDDAGLPRYWRSVLFMDVFGEAADPTQMDIDTGLKVLTKEEKSVVYEVAVEAVAQLQHARSAVRRWQAVPKEAKSQGQVDRVEKCAKSVSDWASLLSSELRRRKLNNLNVEVQTRPWSQLSNRERDEDPLAGYVVGPLEHYVGAGLRGVFYYDVENGEERHEENINGWHVLTVVEMRAHCKLFEDAVDKVLQAGRNPTEQAFEAPPPLMSDTGYRTLAGQFPREMTRESTTDHDAADESTSESGSDGNIERRVTSRWIALRGSSKQKDELHVQPVRLPWTLLSVVTRAVQIVWAVALVTHTLEAALIIRWDFAKNPSGMAEVLKDEEHEFFNYRRLKSITHDGADSHNVSDPGPSTLQAHAIKVKWPYGAFFRPESLDCLVDPEAESSTTAGQQHRLMISSKAILYVGRRNFTTARKEPEQALRLRSQPSAGAGIPLGLACGGTALKQDVPCFLLGVVEGGQLTLSSPPAQDDTASRPWTLQLPLPQKDTGSWNLVSGAILPCPRLQQKEQVVGLRNGTEELLETACLLVAGASSGSADISIAMARIRLSSPSSVAEVTPLRTLFKLRTAGKVSALHLEAQSSRLVAITDDNIVHSWSFHDCTPWKTGSFRLSLPFVMTSARETVSPSGICSLPSGETYITGHAATYYGHSEPWLLRTSLVGTFRMPPTALVAV